MSPETMWNLFLEEVKLWYGVEPKSFLGSVDKHKVCFLRALKPNEK